jgi:hypothetical protein
VVGRSARLLLAEVDVDDLVEQGQRFVAGALEGVAADDGAVAAAVADVARVLVDGVAALGGAAGEDDEAPAVEAAWTTWRTRAGCGRSRGLVAFLRVRSIGRSAASPDDVRAEMAAMCAIGDHVVREFDLLASLPRAVAPITVARPKRPSPPPTCSAICCMDSKIASEPG